MNKNNHFMEPVGFHMVKSEGDNHSFTKEEMDEYLEKKAKEVIKAAKNIKTWRLLTHLGYRSVARIPIDTVY